MSSATDGSDDGSEYDNGLYDPPAPTPRPKVRDVDGRPAREPPVFCYPDMIGEDYENKTEALLKHFDGGRAKVSAYMEVENEFDVLIMFSDCLDDSQTAARKEADVGKEDWFKALEDDRDLDFQEVDKQVSDFELRFVQEDGGDRLCINGWELRGADGKRSLRIRKLMGIRGPPNAPLEHDEDCPMARCCTSECEKKESFCDVESTTNSDDQPLDNSEAATLKPSYFHTTTTDEDWVTTSIEDIAVASPFTSIPDDSTKS